MWKWLLFSLSNEIQSKFKRQFHSLNETFYNQAQTIFSNSELFGCLCVCISFGEIIMKQRARNEKRVGNSPFSFELNDYLNR